MGAEADFCCEAVRKRHAQLNNSTSAGNGDPGSSGKKKNGSYKEEMRNAIAREKKIQKTKVSFFDFWYECVDWEMLKLFYALLMLFFCTVGIAVALYLLYVFNFNEKLWYFYFPVREGFKCYQATYIKSKISLKICKGKAKLKIFFIFQC